MSTYTELEKLDDFLGLPRGTARSVVSLHDRSQLAVLNERLAQHGISLDEDTAVSQRSRLAWKALLQQLGISNAWWFDGDPTCLRPDRRKDPIPDLRGYDHLLDE